jgi:hypothetical protein
VYEQEHAQGRRSQPGCVSLHGNGAGGSSSRGVVNLFGQRYPGPPKDANGDGKRQREQWFAQALQALGAHPSVQGQHISLAFPCEIGCGLAGGDWVVYQRMIEDFTRNRPTLTVTIVRFGGVAPGKRARC